MNEQPIKDEPDDEQSRHRKSRRITELADQVRHETGAAVRIPAKLLKAMIVVVELHAGTSRFSKAARTRWGCRVRMVDIQDVVEWSDDFERTDKCIKFVQADINEMDELEILELLDGAHVLWAAPTCARFSNQTEAQEQHHGYKAPGHEGEGSTPRGKQSDAHVLKILKILKIAKDHCPGIQIVIENPDAGLPLLHTGRQLAPQLGLKMLVINYCALHDDYPYKRTVLLTNCKMMIDAYKNGKRKCSNSCSCSWARDRDIHKERTDGYKHKVLPKDTVEAAAYPPKWAEEFAYFLIYDARKKIVEARAREAGGLQWVDDDDDDDG